MLHIQTSPARLSLWLQSLPSSAHPQCVQLYTQFPAREDSAPTTHMHTTSSLPRLCPNCRLCVLCVVLCSVSCCLELCLPKHAKDKLPIWAEHSLALQLAACCMILFFFENILHATGFIIRESEDEKVRRRCCCKTTF